MQEFPPGGAETIGSQHRVERLPSLLSLLPQLRQLLPHALLLGSGQSQLMFELLDGLIQHRLLFLHAGNIALQHPAGFFKLACCGDPLIKLPQKFG
ncbi:hypothetical protein, partial [Desulfovibrio piger]|uniref:hypothetical protein n=1 Tax=Desulfovibrio piger TaxID=901 RepID=UPI0030769844